MTSTGTTLVTSASFSFTPGYSATFGGLLEEGRAFSDPFFSRLATSGGMSALELLEEGGWMVSG